MVHQFDDVKVWLDNDGNGTLDSGDAVQVVDAFNSNVLSLSYDDTLDPAGPRQGQAGNLTGDRLYKYARMGGCPEWH